MEIFERLSLKINNLLERSRFKTSADYWEQRYLSGGTSGSGSANRLAEFKANFLNEFVRNNGIASVIEFGSGDGSQLALAKYPCYLGVDVSQAAVELGREKFGGAANIRIIHLSEFDVVSAADLTLSLDVIFHLVEDEVFESYMGRLFSASKRWVIIYSDAKKSSTS